MMTTTAPVKPLLKANSFERNFVNNLAEPRFVLGAIERAQSMMKDAQSWQTIQSPAEIALNFRNEVAAVEGYEVAETIAHQLWPELIEQDIADIEFAEAA